MQIYAGKTYIWYINASLVEIDDQYQINNSGYVCNIFPGIPEDISGDFRSLEGHIYFSHKKLEMCLKMYLMFNFELINSSVPES